MSNYYTCTSDKYDNNPDNKYVSVHEFRAMCDACFGEIPVLTTSDDGDTYEDGCGEVVLRRGSSD